MVHYIQICFALIFASSHVFAENKDEDAEVASCIELFNPENLNKKCCETMNLLEETIYSTNRSDSKEWTCKDSKQLFKNYGIPDSDKIDEAKIGEFLDKIEAENPKEQPTVQRVRTACLNGGFDDYPPSEPCPHIKFLICLFINSIVECTSWKEDDGCSAYAEHAKKCKNLMDKEEKDSKQ